MLERVDGHAVVANSAAMKAAGITAQPSRRPGGRIENGLFVDAATRPRSERPFRPHAGRADQALAKAQEMLLAVGVTARRIMGTSVDDWAAMQSRRRRRAAQRPHHESMPAASKLHDGRAARRPAGCTGTGCAMVGVKLYADGALGSRGAWLKQPYADKPDTRGLQFLRDAEMLDQADKAASAGFQVAIHAIGDAANAQVISTYEQLSKKYGTDRRWRIEHFQIVDPSRHSAPCSRRHHRLDAADPPDQRPADGGEEARTGPAGRRLCLADGAEVRCADSPSGPISRWNRPIPSPGLAAAISRQDMKASRPAAGFPSERVTLRAGARGFTRDAAYAVSPRTRSARSIPANGRISSSSTATS